MAALQGLRIQACRGQACSSHRAGHLACCPRACPCSGRPCRGRPWVSSFAEYVFWCQAGNVMSCAGWLPHILQAPVFPALPAGAEYPAQCSGPARPCSKPHCLLLCCRHDAAAGLPWGYASPAAAHGSIWAASDGLWWTAATSPGKQQSSQLCLPCQHLAAHASTLFPLACAGIWTSMTGSFACCISLLARACCMQDLNPAAGFPARARHGRAGASRGCTAPHAAPDAAASSACAAAEYADGSLRSTWHPRRRCCWRVCKCLDGAHCP